jgi:MoxR-like ATPase
MSTNTTSRILDVLEQERAKIILFDELDKMGRVFQNQLLNFLEAYQGGPSEVPMKHIFNNNITRKS